MFVLLLDPGSRAVSSTESESMESIFVNLITVAGSEADMSIIGLLMKASVVVKAVIVVLILMSLATWYIIIFKWNYLRKAKRESASFLETFWASKLDEIYRFSDELEYSPISQVFRAGYVELTKVKSDSSSTPCMARWAAWRISNAASSSKR